MFSRSIERNQWHGMGWRAIKWGAYRTAATSKVELFVIILNGWKPLAIITKSSTLDVAAVLDPPLNKLYNFHFLTSYCFEFIRPSRINHNKSLSHEKEKRFPETFLGSCEKSMMKLSCLINGVQPLTIFPEKDSIIDVW